MDTAGVVKGNTLISENTRTHFWTLLVEDNVLITGGCDMLLFAHCDIHDCIQHGGKGMCGACNHCISGLTFHMKQEGIL